MWELVNMYSSAVTWSRTLSAD